MSYISLTSVGDPTEQWYNTENGNVTTVVDLNPLMEYNYLLRMGGNNGFSPDRKWRHIGSIELSVVKGLADTQNDPDAYAYYYEGDKKALVRMIERHPDLFKACSGSI